jgi:hypothetical protein
MRLFIVAWSLTGLVVGCANEHAELADAGIEQTPGSDVALTILTATVDRSHVAVEARLTDLAGQPIPRDGFETQWTLAAFTTQATLPNRSTYSLVNRPAPSIEKAKHETSGRKYAPATAVLMAAGMIGMTCDPRQSPVTKWPSV